MFILISELEKKIILIENNKGKINILDEYELFIFKNEYKFCVKITEKNEVFLGRNGECYYIIEKYKIKKIDKYFYYDIKSKEYIISDKKDNYFKIVDDPNIFDKNELEITLPYEKSWNLLSVDIIKYFDIDIYIVIYDKKKYGLMLMFDSESESNQLDEVNPNIIKNFYDFKYPIWIYTVDNDKMELIDEQNEIQIPMNMFYKYETSEYIYFCSSIEVEDKEFHNLGKRVLIYKINNSGKIKKKYINAEYITNKNNLYESKKNIYENMCCYDNYILYYNEDENLIIYDYINDEIIMSDKFNKMLSMDSFAKVNEIKDVKQNINNFIGKENIKIKLLDGIYETTTDVLLSISDYFENILNNKKELILNVEYDIFDKLMKFEINEININEMLELYNLSVLISYKKLKEHLYNILYIKYRIDENITTIKIFNEKSLKFLPKTIKTIKFYKDFKVDINGDIPEGISKLIFGASFNIPISNIPTTVRILEFGKSWNQDLRHIPYFIEEIKLSYEFNKNIDEKYLPKNLNTLYLHNEYSNKRKCINVSSNINVKYHSIKNEIDSNSDSDDERYHKHDYTCNDNTNLSR